MQRATRVILCRCLHFLVFFYEERSLNRSVDKKKNNIIFFHRPVDVDGANETAIIMSTSGSTGLSKGIQFKDNL